MQTRICPSCKLDFQVSTAELGLLERLAPTFAGRRIELPAPELCPSCRQQRRACFRNERKLYHDNCDLCHKGMISLYSPDKPFKVYCQSCWWRDSWEAEQFGREYDPNKSFFAQFAELQRATPRPAIFNLNSENSEYANHSAFNKNCFMGVAIGNSEDCSFGTWVLRSRRCFDCLYIEHCEECYECSYCRNCHESYFCQHCFQVQSCLFCYECRNCDHCIGCVNGQHLKFHVLNQAVSPDEYEQLRAELLTSREVFAEFQKKFMALRLSLPHRPSVQVNCENCSGNDIYNCRESYNCYNCRDLEHCLHMFDLGSLKLSMDCYEHGWLVPGELNYQCHAGMAGYNLLFCNICADSRRLLYCDLCFNDCSDCFGCVSLKKKRHNILNKQYSEKEYENLCLAICEKMKRDGEWGQFFPGKLSPFGYNETSANEFFPLEVEEMLAQAFSHCSYEAPQPKASKTVSAASLPADITAVADEVLELALICEKSGKLYRITKAELQFYRSHGLPLPLCHPDERHATRIRARYPRFIWQRTCPKCTSIFSSSVPPHFAEEVYCESCFMQAFY